MTAASTPAGRADARSRRGSSTCTSAPRSTARRRPSSSRCSRPTGRVARPLLAAAARRGGAPRERPHAAAARSATQVVADLESEHRRLAAAWARHTGQRRPAGAPGGDAATATSATDEPDDATSSPASSSCRSRGSRVGSSRGRRVASTPRRRRPTRSPRCSPPPARRPSGWTRHAPVPVPGGGRRRGARRFRSARCSAGSSRRAPDQVGDDIGAERALAGPGRDLGGRAHRARRDGAVPPPAQARQRQRPRVERLVLGALDARARRPDAPRALVADDARRRAARSIRTSTRVRSPAPRSPAWSTRSAATARVGSRCPRRRRASARRPTSPKRSSPGSTAARSTRRCASPARSRRASSGGAVR